MPRPGFSARSIRPAVPSLALLARRHQRDAVEPGVVQFAHHAHHAAVIERAIGAQEDLWRLIAGHAGRDLLEPRGQPFGADLVIVDEDAAALVERDLDRLLILIERVGAARSEEHTSELQSLMRTSYAVFC